MSPRYVVFIFLTCAAGCGASGAPAATARAPASAKPATDPCLRIVPALKRSDETLGSTPTNLAPALAEERKEIAAATAGVDRFATLAKNYDRANADAAEIFRASESALAFADKMGAFMSHCTAPDCGPVIMQIGAHTMHQPDLGATLPLLATELEKNHLADGGMQAEMLDLARTCRKAAAGMPRDGDPRLPAFTAARTALRDACAKPT